MPSRDWMNDFAPSCGPARNANAFAGTQAISGSALRSEERAVSSSGDSFERSSGAATSSESPSDAALSATPRPSYASRLAPPETGPSRPGIDRPTPSAP